MKNYFYLDLKISLPKKHDDWPNKNILYISEEKINCFTFGVSECKKYVEFSYKYVEESTSNGFAARKHLTIEQCTVKLLISIETAQFYGKTKIINSCKSQDIGSWAGSNSKCYTKTRYFK